MMKENKKQIRKALQNWAMSKVRRSDLLWNCFDFWINFTWCDIAIEVVMSVLVSSMRSTLGSSLCDLVVSSIGIQGEKKRWGRKKKGRKWEEDWSLGLTWVTKKIDDVRWCWRRFLATTTTTTMSGGVDCNDYEVEENASSKVDN